VSVVLDYSERRFQVWAYSVSLGRLLLRSTKSDTFPTRVDVLFQNVKALKLPTSLDGLTIAEADDDERSEIEAATGIVLDVDAAGFVVRCGSMDGFVVAGVCVGREDDAEHFEPSDLWLEPT
jgi:hypothetical protein